MIEVVTHLLAAGVGALFAGAYMARRARRFDVLVAGDPAEPSEFARFWADQPRHHHGGAN